MIIITLALNKNCDNKCYQSGSVPIIQSFQSFRQSKKNKITFGIRLFLKQRSFPKLGQRLD